MTAFRTLLVLMIATMAVYTGFVVAAHGWGLVPVFFGDIRAMAWPGQFNLDFACMLVLSALWTAWRHQFSAAGLGLAAVALVGGTPWLATYLLVASVQAKGDARVLLLGPARAAA